MALWPGRYRHWARCLSVVLSLLIVVTVELALPRHGQAHPHVWIDALTEVVFDDNGRFSGVRVYWVFDEFYSTYAIEGLDSNDNGELEPNELAPLAADNVRNLKEFGYFTWVKVNGKAAAFGDVTDYGLRYVNNRLALWFLLPLLTPVDPQKAQVSFSLYDPTYYISIELVGNAPIRTTGTVPSGCNFKIDAAEGSEDNRTLSESFFQSLDPSTTTFGAQFAPNIRIMCTESN